MKKNYFVALTLAGVVILFSFTRVHKSYDLEKYQNSHLKNRSGSPTGKTGAPGEATCTQCHSGTIQSGITMNILTLTPVGELTPVTEYTPGVQYNGHFEMTSTATRKGFQLTALVTSNSSTAGTLAAISGSTSLTSSPSRKYINHTTTSSSSTTGWNFTWTAPAGNAGTIKFYIASNVTNNNANDNGDVIYTSQHTFAPIAGAGIEEQSSAIRFAAGYSSENNSLFLDFNTPKSGYGYVNLIDITGKSVYNTSLNQVKTGNNSETVVLPNELKNGIYIVHLFVDNQSVTRKINIQK